MGRQKIIAVDMDEVIADFISKELRIYEEEFGIKYSMSDLEGKELFQMVDPTHREAVLSYPYRQGFFADLPVIEGSARVLPELQKKYEVFIVSAATEFPNSLLEKYNWLKSHFPVIDWRHMVFCGYKSIIRADYLLDDRADNLMMFSGEPLLFSAPHNSGVTQFKRLNNWDEVEDYFLG